MSRPLSITSSLLPLSWTHFNPISPDLLSIHLIHVCTQGQRMRLLVLHLVGATCKSWVSAVSFRGDLMEAQYSYALRHSISTSWGSFQRIQDITKIPLGIEGECSGLSEGHTQEGIMLESVDMVLTQPGTLVSFWGMCIHLLFDFWKLQNFQCFPFPENSGTPTFPISRKFQTPTFFDISHSFMYFTFHLWLRSFPLFHVIVLVYVLRSPLCTWYILVPLLSL